MFSNRSRQPLNATLARNGLRIVLHTAEFTESRGPASPLPVQLVLNQHAADIDGNACLTGSISTECIFDEIGSLKAEWDYLLDDAICWLARTIEARLEFCGDIPSRAASELVEQDGANQATHKISARPLQLPIVPRTAKTERSNVSGNRASPRSQTIYPAEHKEFLPLFPRSVDTKTDAKAKPRAVETIETVMHLATAIEALVAALRRYDDARASL